MAAAPRPSGGRDRELRGWIAWYRFARERLGYGDREAAAYAGLREVEEQNRAFLAARGRLPRAGR